MHHLLPPSLTFSHFLPPSLTFSHLLSTSLNVSQLLSAGLLQAAGSLRQPIEGVRRGRRGQGRREPARGEWGGVGQRRRRASEHGSARHDPVAPVQMVGASATVSKAATSPPRFAARGPPRPPSASLGLPRPPILILPRPPPPHAPSASHPHPLQVSRSLLYQLASLFGRGAQLPAVVGEGGELLDGRVDGRGASSAAPSTVIYPAPGTVSGAASRPRAADEAAGDARRRRQHGARGVAGVGVPPCIAHRVLEVADAAAQPEAVCRALRAMRPRACLVVLPTDASVTRWAERLSGAGLPQVASLAHERQQLPSSATDLPGAALDFAPWLPPGLPPRLSSPTPRQPFDYPSTALRVRLTASAFGRCVQLPETTSECPGWPQVKLLHEVMGFPTRRPSGRGEGMQGDMQGGMQGEVDRRAAVATSVTPDASVDASRLFEALGRARGAPETALALAPKPPSRRERAKRRVEAAEGRSAEEGESMAAPPASSIAESSTAESSTAEFPAESTAVSTADEPPMRVLLTTERSVRMRLMASDGL